MAIIKPNNNTLSAITSLPAAIPTGKVLQALQANDLTARATSSSSYVTASNTLSLTITPSSTSSKVLILVSSTGGNTTAGNAGHATIYRNSTNLGTSHGMAQFYGGSSDTRSAIGIKFLDSPNTTSATTYQVYIKTNGTGNMDLNWNGANGNIQVFEIAG